MQMSELQAKSNNNLALCPFCGGEAQMGINKESTVREYFVGCMNCHIRLYKIGYKRFYTEAEAIAAWNTRADYHGYEQAAIEAWESIKAWNSRAERTFHIEHPYYGDAPVINGQPRCSECETEFAVGAFPHYCPNCGARRVDE